MLKIELIGNLGADADIKDVNGSKFVTMRVANTDKWKDEQGNTKERTTWIDVTYNNVESSVVPFLKAGVKVFIRGNGSTRIYSSQKDRCMKAGLKVAATEIELCGGQSEAVPKQLILPETGAIVDVVKFYQAQCDTSKWKKEDVGFLVDTKGGQYQMVKGGWVCPIEGEQKQETAQEGESK